MWKSLLASLLFASPLLAQEHPSAYEALRVIGTQLNRQAVNHVVSVNGADGDPQPRAWKVVVEDTNAANGVREYLVEDNRIASQRAPNRSVVGSTQGATIDTAKLNLDSTGAYSVAAHTAETSHVTFSLANYTLRTDERGNPIWIVSLADNRNRPVGSIHIRASDGRIKRVEGMYQGRNMEQVEENPDIDRPPTVENGPPPSDEVTDEDDSGEGELVFKDIKRMFHRTTHDAARIFHKVRRSFVDFFNH